MYTQIVHDSMCIQVSHGVVVVVGIFARMTKMQYLLGLDIDTRVSMVLTVLGEHFNYL